MVGKPIFFDYNLLYYVDKVSCLSNTHFIQYRYLLRFVKISKLLSFVTLIECYLSAIITTPFPLLTGVFKLHYVLLNNINKIISVYVC